MLYPQWLMCNRSFTRAIMSLKAIIKLWTSKEWINQSNAFKIKQKYCSLNITSCQGPFVSLETYNSTFQIFEIRRFRNLCNVSIGIFVTALLCDECYKCMFLYYIDILPFFQNGCQNSMSRVSKKSLYPGSPDKDLLTFNMVASLRTFRPDHGPTEFDYGLFSMSTVCGFIM